MSPRTTSTATAPKGVASTPYSRRPAQPKSSRQQFSACGACRMRRVRCDLKDLPGSASSSRPACSNCTERGLRCVDEFAEIKAVKLLRRGRRLQQVEAIYGKTPNGPSSFPSDSRLSTSFPQLSTDFFSSPFWKWFTVHRPVLDPVEFPTRFIAHTKGTSLLGHEGGLLAMLLVLWAASFGLDECGSPVTSECLFLPSTDGISTTLSTEQSNHIPIDLRTRQRKRRKDRADVMLREILELIDFHGILRRPTWDGVKVLLLLLPLLEDAHPLERHAISEAALSHAQALCLKSSSVDSDGASVRAQIFWYAYLNESMTTGLRGGRLCLHSEDLDSFQRTIPYNSIAGSNDFANSSSFHTLSGSGTTQLNSQLGTASKAFLPLFHVFSLPLQLGSICRKIHQVLTGPKAIKRAEEHGLVEAYGMREIWEDLDRCWKEFGSMRRMTLDTFDTERYVSAWQIFIFECQNRIRETLKQLMSSMSENFQGAYSTPSPSRPESHSASSPYLSPQSLHVIATRKCLVILPLVLSIIGFHMSDERKGDLFKWDSGFVREGCFFAGYLAASFEGETIDVSLENGNEDPVHGNINWNVEDGVAICLKSLDDMRWSYSKSDERSETIRFLWDCKKNGRQSSRLSYTYQSRYNQQYGSDTFLFDLSSLYHCRPMTAGAISSVSQLSGSDQPLLPPLQFLRSPRRADSAPSTGYTTTGHGGNGWPTYTPPGSTTSLATSIGTGISVPASSDFSGVGSHTVPVVTFKATQDPYHETHQELDQFTFNVPASNISDSIAIGPGTHYCHRDPPSSAHSVHGTTTSMFINSASFPTQGTVDLSTANDSSPTCSRLVDDRNSFYN